MAPSNLGRGVASSGHDATQAGQSQRVAKAAAGKGRTERVPPATDPGLGGSTTGAQRAEGRAFGSSKVARGGHSMSGLKGEHHEAQLPIALPWTFRRPSTLGLNCPRPSEPETWLSFGLPGDSDA